MRSNKDTLKRISARLDAIDAALTRRYFRGEGPDLEYEEWMGDTRTGLAAARQKVRELEDADEQRYLEIMRDLTEDVIALGNALSLLEAGAERGGGREE